MDINDIVVRLRYSLYENSQVKVEEDEDIYLRLDYFLLF